MSHTRFSSGSALWRPLSGVHFQCVLGALNLLHPSRQATYKRSFLQRASTLNRKRDAHPQRPGCVLSVKNLEYQIWVCGPEWPHSNLTPSSWNSPALSQTYLQSRLGEKSQSLVWEAFAGHTFIKRELILRPHWIWVHSCPLPLFSSICGILDRPWLNILWITYSSFYKCSSALTFLMMTGGNTVASIRKSRFQQY